MMIDVSIIIIESQQRYYHVRCQPLSQLWDIIIFLLFYLQSPFR